MTPSLSRDARDRLCQIRRSSLPLTIILAVGVDSSLMARYRPFWESAGYYVTFAESIREAIVQFRDGDFDLILLSHSLPIESRERLTFLIRTSGSGIPVVCFANSPSDNDGFADATIRNGWDDLPQVLEELLTTRSKSSVGSAACESDEKSQFQILKEIRTLQMLLPRNTSKKEGGPR